MSAGNKLLEGVRVLDLSRQLAGPFATMTMADLGAEVIKIEPDKGDDSRYWGPFVDGESCYFWSCNRGKRSIVIDMKTAEGQSVVRKLSVHSDILIENFREGVMQRLGLDYESLRGSNPKLVYCHITGYGEKGPDAHRPAVDIAVQATTGLMSVTGYKDQAPVRVGMSIADLATGALGVAGILAAYINADRTGHGQKVSLSLMETMVSFLTYHAQGYLSTGAVPEKYGSGIQNIEPYRVVRTQNGYIALGVGNDVNFRRLSELIGKPELAVDPRFVRNEDRWANRGKLIPIIEEFFAGCDTDEIERALAEKEIPSGAVRNVGEVLESEQVSAMGMIVNVPRPGKPALRMVRAPMVFSAADNCAELAPPLLGADTESILAEAGYSVDEIAQMRERRVISGGRP
jgi:crotonobetainyl-CoA:carnitine CoA-transferase CaiB-like acyl-CoA transferase